MTEETERLLKKHYGRKPGDQSHFTPKELADIKAGRDKMMDMFGPGPRELDEVRRSVEIESIGEQEIQDILFRSVNKKLWRQVRAAMVLRGARRKDMLEAAFRMWLGGEDDSDKRSTGDPK